MAREIPVTYPLLFLRYAVPCAGTLVKRGTLAQAEWDRLIAAVAAGRAPAGAERIFKVALAACSLLAIDSGKQAIDAAVVRQYFRAGHDAVIDARSREMGDFSPEACRVWAGRVQSVQSGRAVVETPAGLRTCKTDFVDARVGEWVIVHWDFLVEPVSAEGAARINTRPGAKKG
ncbi:MAG TPA: HypC/HybG/HupF family hydrogenase formation chaperone [archaeon]|nr:HypC/HybG/HupF family hydrogenase formation chaperone [archaeon]